MRAQMGALVDSILTTTLAAGNTSGAHALMGPGGPGAGGPGGVDDGTAAG